MEEFLLAQERRKLRAAGSLEEFLLTQERRKERAADVRRFVPVRRARNGCKELHASTSGPPDIAEP
jgi:hypothetical protein